MAQKSNPTQTGIPVHNRESFLAIPNELIRNFSEISGNEFKVLLYLLITRNLKDKTYGLVKEISAYTGFHPNTVYSIVGSLKKLGLVQSKRLKSGIVISIIFLKDSKFSNVFGKIKENLALGKTKIFSGIRYLFFKDKENRDFKNSTFLDNLFSSFLVRIAGTENSFTLDSSERSFFKELSGNHLKLLVYFKYLSQFKDCEFFKASYFRIEKATGLKHTTINKLLSELCDKYQFIGRENYKKNKKRYFFNYVINGVSMSEKRAAQKAKPVFTKTEVQKDLVSQKTDFLCTKQISNLIKDISAKKSFEAVIAFKSPEITIESKPKIIESRADEIIIPKKQEYISIKVSDPSLERDIDLSFIEELKRLKGGYYNRPNET